MMISERTIFIVMTSIKTSGILCPKRVMFLPEEAVLEVYLGKILCFSLEDI